MSRTTALPLTLEWLKAQLVASAAWVAWCGGDADRAAQSVYLIEAPPTAPMPLAICDFDLGVRLTRDDVAPDASFTLRGSLLLRFMAEADAAPTVMIDLVEQMNRVLDDLSKAATDGGTSSLLTEIELLDGPSRVRAIDRQRSCDGVDCLWRLGFERWPA